jgi:hypothetical protein
MLIVSLKQQRECIGIGRCGSHRRAQAIDCGPVAAAPPSSVMNSRRFIR